MARQRRRDKTDILTRTEKWEIKLSPEVEKLILKISDALREYGNWALKAEQKANELWETAKKAAPDTKPNAKRFLNEIDLYNLWKLVREEDAKNDFFRGKVPANWALETFRSVVGAYTSFFALVKNGDTDARTPTERPEWRFQVVPGCSAFSMKAGRIVLAPEIFGRDTLSFPIPPAYQTKMLGRSVRVAKFIIHRDEPDLRRPGRYWISVSYEIPKPEQKLFVPQEAVFVALGASSIGVVSPKGEEVVELWRSDKHWMPEIDTVGEFLTGTPRAEQSRGDLRRPALKKGSKQWRKLRAAHRNMYGIMARQQTLDRREVVATNLIEKVVDNVIRGHGMHFVVTEYVVRSKEGKLADASRKERGGALGLNWSAQNTGTIGYVLHWLKVKAPEYGGSVRVVKLPYEALPKGLPKGHENKILIARALRDHFLNLEKKAA